jgi:hypothetical protein
MISLLTRNHTRNLLVQYGGSNYIVREMYVLKQRTQPTAAALKTRPIPCSRVYVLPNGWYQRMKK